MEVYEAKARVACRGLQKPVPPDHARLVLKYQHLYHIQDGNLSNYLNQKY